MGRKKLPEDRSTQQIGVRLDKEELTDIDAEIARVRETTGVQVTRSAIIRAWIDEARKRGKETPRRGPTKRQRRD